MSRFAITAFAVLALAAAESATPLSARQAAEAATPAAPTEETTIPAAPVDSGPQAYLTNPVVIDVAVPEESAAPGADPEASADPAEPTDSSEPSGDPSDAPDTADPTGEPSVAPDSADPENATPPGGCGNCQGGLVCTKTPWKGPSTSECLPEAPQCYLAGERNIGEPGKIYVPHAPCCDGKGSVSRPGEYGFFCPGGDSGPAQEPETTVA